MTRARTLAACAAAVALTAGCGAQKPVTRTIPGDFLGYKLVQLPRGYGIKCPSAMQARQRGSGEGASMLVDADGVQLVTAALRFDDAAAAGRAYAASISPEAQRCFADGFVAELTRRYGVKVRRVRTGPANVDPQIGDERSATRVSVVIAAGRREATLSVDSTAVRIGSALSIDQAIDVTALGRRGGEPDLQLAAAVS